MRSGSSRRASTLQYTGPACRALTRRPLLLTLGARGQRANCTRRGGRPSRWVACGKWKTRFSTFWSTSSTTTCSKSCRCTPSAPISPAIWRSPGFAARTSSARSTGWRTWPTSASVRACAPTSAPSGSTQPRRARGWMPPAAACCCRSSAAASCRPTQREIVIERLLALDTEELSLEQVKWVVLMVLSCQPGRGSGLRAHGRYAV